MKSSKREKSKAKFYVISAFLVIIYLFPIYVMLNQSFRFYTDLTPRLYLPEKWTLSNYMESLASTELINAFKNSVIYVVEVSALEIIFGGMAAHGLARAGGRLSRSLRTLNIAIMMLPPLSLLVGTYSLMVNLNMVNKIWALSLQSAAMGMASTMFFYTSFIVTIPKELDESASLDGAGLLRTYFQIIFPQLKAITVTRLVMVVVGTWNNYSMPSYLLTSVDKATVVLVVRKAFSVAAGAVQNVPLACAKCVIGLLPVILLYLFLQRFIIEGQLGSVNK